MQTLSVPEHHDFEKARQAMMITSIMLIIIINTDFQSDTITVLGLTLGVSHLKLVWFWGSVVSYFTLTFMWRAWNEGRTRRDKIRIEAARDAVFQAARGAALLKNTSPFREATYTGDASIVESQHEFDKQIEKDIKSGQARREFLIFVIVDGIMPSTVMVFALWSWIKFIVEHYP